jgi:DNA-binding beta-propeller fold protein YncE
MPNIRKGLMGAAGGVGVAPWDLTTLSYIGSKAITGTEGQGMWFSPDGTEMYFNENYYKSVDQWSLSTAWDVTSATFTRVQSYTGMSSTRGVTLSPDGTKMFITDASLDDVFRFTLSTPWNISSKVYHSRATTGGSLGAGQDTHVQFSSDGLEMTIFQRAGTSGFNQYTLSTPYDITSHTKVGAKYGAIANFTEAGFMGWDGTQALVNFSGIIQSHTFSTPYLMSSGAVDTGNTYNMTAQSTSTNSSTGLYVSPDHEHLYALAYHVVYQYDF